MSSASKRSSLNELEPEEAPIPKTTLISTRRDAAAEPGPVATGDSVPFILPKHLVNLAEKHRAKPDKKQTTVRFEPWLNQAINNHLAQIMIQTGTTLSREAVITEAIVQYLGLKAPKP